MQIHKFLEMCVVSAGACPHPSPDVRCARCLRSRMRSRTIGLLRGPPRHGHVPGSSHANIDLAMPLRSWCVPAWIWPGVQAGAQVPRSTNSEQVLALPCVKANQPGQHAQTTARLARASTKQPPSPGPVAAWQTQYLRLHVPHVYPCAR